jgi:protein-S-isoprenylcysteine O-methyltransferase Ste14
VVYVLFLAVFIYAIGFVGTIAVPKSVDSGTQTSVVAALVIDALLLAAFAIQHSVMARQWFKRAWTKLVPAAVERTTYVLFATLILALVMWQWRPVTAVVWEVQNPAGQIALRVLFFAGWAVLLISTWLIDHFELFGVRQVLANAGATTPATYSFKDPLFYKFVRHPIYLGFVIAFWSTARMTVGHLFFAIMCTGYMLVAIQFEERDLVRHYGDTYREYRRRVSMLLPLPARRANLEARSSAQRAGE